MTKPTGADFITISEAAELLAVSERQARGCPTNAAGQQFAQLCHRSGERATTQATDARRSLAAVARSSQRGIQNQMKQIKPSQLYKISPREESAATLTDSTRQRVADLLEEYQQEKITREEWHEKTEAAVLAQASYHREEAHLKTEKRAPRKAELQHVEANEAADEAADAELYKTVSDRLKTFEKVIADAAPEQWKRIINSLVPKNG